MFIAVPILGLLWFAMLMSIFWNSIGIPTAIGLAIIRFRKNKQQKKQYNRAILICLTGIPIALGTLLLFLIFQILLMLLRLPTFTLSR
jgi:hypothetical protein